jgi:hypothetical protein
MMDSDEMTVMIMWSTPWENSRSSREDPKYKQEVHDIKWKKHEQRDTRKHSSVSSEH